MMSKLNIPTIGAEFVLASDWEFTLHSDYRNHKLWGKYKELIDPSLPQQDYQTRNIAVTLPAGTVISVSRIYIRAGKGDYDSITFSIKSCPAKGMKGRFWVKLEDANEMEYVV